MERVCWRLYGGVSHVAVLGTAKLRISQNLKLTKIILATSYSVFEIISFRQYTFLNLIDKVSPRSMAVWKSWQASDKYPVFNNLIPLL
jgi:hypothetical protein